MRQPLCRLLRFWAPAFRSLSSLLRPQLRRCRGRGLQQARCAQQRLLGQLPAAVGRQAAHFGGPLQVSFYGDLPKMRLGRECDFVLVVGTPGVGNGTSSVPGTFSARNIDRPR